MDLNCLLGFSFGGLIAFEMARRLPEGQIALLVLVDTKAMGKTTASQARPRDLAAGIRRRPTSFVRPKTLAGLVEKIHAKLFRIAYTCFEFFQVRIPGVLARAYDINWFAAVRYVPRAFPGRIVLLKLSAWKDNDPGMVDWSPFAGQGVEIHNISGSHEDLFIEPHVQELAKAIEELLGSNGSSSIPACGSKFHMRRTVSSSASKLTGQQQTSVCEGHCSERRVSGVPY
jgi:thioesterase domain-containing protein